MRIGSILNFAAKAVSFIPGLGPLASAGLQAGIGIAARATDGGADQGQKAQGILGILSNFFAGLGGKTAAWASKVVDFALGLFQGKRSAAEDFNSKIG